MYIELNMLLKDEAKMNSFLASSPKSVFLTNTRALRCFAAFSMSQRATFTYIIVSRIFKNKMRVGARIAKLTFIHVESTIVISWNELRVSYLY
jgi:hypothetical protein